MHEKHNSTRQSRICYECWLELTTCKHWSLRENGELTSELWCYLYCRPKVSALVNLLRRFPFLHLRVKRKQKLDTSVRCALNTLTHWRSKKNRSFRSRFWSCLQCLCFGWSASLALLFFSFLFPFFLSFFFRQDARSPEVGLDPQTKRRLILHHTLINVIHYVHFKNTHTHTLGFFFVPNIDYAYTIYVYRPNDHNEIKIQHNTFIIIINNSKTITELLLLLLLLGYDYYTNCIFTISNKNSLFIP